MSLTLKPLHQNTETSKCYTPTGRGKTVKECVLFFSGPKYFMPKIWLTNLKRLYITHCKCLQVYIGLGRISTLLVVHCGLVETQVCPEQS